MKRSIDNRERSRMIVGLGGAVLLALSAEAAAIDRPCPAGKVWNAARGACVEKKVAPKRSPAQKFYLGSRHIDKSIKRANPRYGVQLVKQACRGRHGEACTLLGFLHLNGRIVKQDAKSSLRFYDRGCKLKDPYGCIGAADVHARGVLGKIDHAAAIPFLERACTLKNGQGCYELGVKYAVALGTKRDDKKAQDLYKEAFALLRRECDNKLGGSCHLLGVSYRLGRGTRISYKDAYNAFQAGCEAGSGKACYELGVATSFGRGVAPDKNKALRIYDKACREFDTPPACYNAGVVVVINNAGTEADRKNLMFWGQRACELDKQWCNLLGYLYSTGKGGTKDEAKAVSYFETACNHGSKEACKAAAERYFEGRGTAKDAEKGAKLYQRACDMGLGDACGDLGVEYYWGRSLKRDRARAFELYKLACLRSDYDSCKRAADALRDGQDGTGVKNPAASATYYRRACYYGEKSLGQSCVSLANLYMSGDGVTKNVHTALLFLDRGCRKEISSACVQYGETYYVGKGVAKDPPRAALSFAKACEYNHWRACSWVDDALRSGTARYYQKYSARRSLERACNSFRRRNNSACMALARAYVRGGGLVNKDSRTGFRMYQEACKRSHREACIEVAHMYSNGTGVVKDLAKARDIYTEQCNQGYNVACTWLGVALRREKRYAEASQLLRRACDRNDALACNEIGFSHYTGRGARWDVAQAYRDYKTACDKKYELGCANLGEMYQHGISVKRDLVKAAEMYEKSCTRSESAGCTALARFHEKGWGGKPRDDARAEELYKRGCNDSYSSSAEACRFLAELYQRNGKQGPSKVAALFQKALDLARESAADNPYGMWVLGQMYRDGVAVVKDPAKALEQFSAGCDGYDPLACMDAGKALMAQKSYEAAAVRFSRACAAGIEWACQQAQLARKYAVSPPKTETETETVGPKVPPKPRGARGGCCDSGAPGGPASTALLAALVLLGVTRRTW